MNIYRLKVIGFARYLLVIAVLASGVGVISASALTFPSTGVLDNFNRANGVIGGDWGGYASAFRIASNQLDTVSGGYDTYLFWKNTSFGADQEAYFTFSQVDADAPEQSLLLKSQNSNSYGNGVIEILYNSSAGVVQIWTFHPSNGWALHGSNIPVVFTPGDQFGARALANGTVEVYKNGTLVGSRNITSWSFYSGGGYIGVWMAEASDSLVDNFGGGTISTTPVNTPTTAPTNTAVPASTNTPVLPTATFTPTSIFTPTPSITPLPPTSTFTATVTSTSAPTNTPLPPTVTNTPSGATVYRVATNGSSNASCGTGWANPCDLQYALNSIVGLNSELWVKQGVYYPGNNRASTFQLKNGVAVYGGFLGSETLRDQRNPNPATNNTVLTGDIGAPGAVADNVYTVVTVLGNLSNTFVLDGFTISGGNSNGGVGHGGGMFIQDSSPILTNLIVSNNAANANGGGVYVLSLATQRSGYSSPILNNVVISNNTAARGGGFYTQNASPVLFNVTLSSNTATGGAGGGMNNQVLDELSDEYSIPLLNNVTFSNNTANGGGGLFNNHSYPELTNVTFSGNTANIRGGAILNEGASPVLRNVTITGHTAPVGQGGSIRNIVNAVGSPSYPGIYNSIIWGNGTDEITSDGTGVVTVVDSIVQGGCPATGDCTNVIDANPLLEPLADNGGFTQTHAMQAGSPAIDAGEVNSACPAVDQRGITRPQGSACDIGPYEYSGIVPPTSTPTITATLPPTATFTAVSTSTNTPIPPTSTFTAVPTFTNTPIPPTATFTAVPTSTNTPIPPTATFTAVPTSTNTPLSPTATYTPTATLTAVPTFTNTPTATYTPTATFTAVPTLTNTPLPPTPTNTPIPPTATNTLAAPGGFPSTTVLDNFNRANGAIGAGWSGYTSSFQIASNQLDVTSGGFDTYIFRNVFYGVNQEAYIIFSQVDEGALTQSLLLKSQRNDSYGNGVIEVLYDAGTDVVQIWSFHPTNGWVQHGANIPVVFANGDQFGARALANGDLEVYKNGILVGTRSMANWPFYTGGGYIGMWFTQASNALVDDFGGGTQ